MSDARPVVLEVALNGVTRPEQNPAVPQEPEAIAEDALRCLEAGATVVHTHTHQPVLQPEAGADLYRRAYEPILARRPDAILYPTVAPGANLEQRYGHVGRLAEAGLIRCAALDTGSVNLGASAADGWPMPMDYVYTNSPSDIRGMLEICKSHALGPSVAIFEPGFLRVVLAAHRAGSLPRGTLVKFYFSAGGFLTEGEPIFGAPPIPEALELYLAMLGDASLPWAVAVLGGSLLDSPIAALALQRGGHLRVGLEDFFSAKSNLDEVERAARLCAEHGRRPATAAETTALLDLPLRSSARTGTLPEREPA